MLGSKTGIVLALALAMAGTAPALAGMNGTDYSNYMDAARRSQPSLQTAPVSAEWQGTAVRRSTTAVTPNPHRYYGRMK